MAPIRMSVFNPKRSGQRVLPSSPDSMDVHALSNIHNQLHVCVVIVIRASRDLYILVRHPNVVGICSQIFWGGHDGELDRPLVAEGLVGPFPHGSDLLDCRNTIVGNQDLRRVLAKRSCTSHINTHICDDGMAIVLSHEVLHGACKSVFQAVPANEVVCELVLGGVGGAAIRNGHSAIEVRLEGRRGPIVKFGHAEGAAARWGRAERRKLAPAGGLWLPGQRRRGRSEELAEGGAQDGWLYVCTYVRMTIYFGREGGGGPD